MRENLLGLVDSTETRVSLRILCMGLVRMMSDVSVMKSETMKCPFPE